MLKNIDLKPIAEAVKERQQTGHRDDDGAPFDLRPVPSEMNPFGGDERGQSRHDPMGVFIGPRKGRDESPVNLERLEPFLEKDDRGRGGQKGRNFAGVLWVHH